MQYIYNSNGETTGVFLTSVEWDRIQEVFAIEGRLTQVNEQQVSYQGKPLSQFTIDEAKKVASMIEYNEKEGYSTPFDLVKFLSKKNKDFNAS